MDLPKRKRNRLSCFNYRNPGYYFITICTQNKENLFWISPDVENQRLTSIGLIVEQCITKIPKIYPMIHLDNYVVMPNHVHLILHLQGYEENPDSPSISNIVGQMKRAVSKLAERNVWQRSFHDHVIRNEKDYQKIWQYVEDNPRKWKEDCFCQDHPTPVSNMVSSNQLLMFDT